jgi:enoyl-CoA hydratase
MTRTTSDSPDPSLLVEAGDGVLEITLNRPDRLNSLTPAMYLALAETWQRYRDDDSLRVAILTGAGTRAFCAGADLAETVPLLTGARKPTSEVDERFLSDLSLMNDALLRDFELHKPVVAAVNGDAIGAGTEILQATDLRVSSADARFGLPEVRQGIIPGGGSVTRLARQIPWALAAEILMLGQPIDASRAHAAGLVNEVVAPEDVMATARQIATRLTQCAPLAVQAIKRGMIESSGRPLAEGLALERRLVAAVMKTEDAREGPRAFLAKRPPVFTGR